MSARLQLSPLGRARAAVAEERRWIAEHGGNRAGYIARYGSARDPEHSGDGGEAIYAADVAALERAEARLRRLEALAARRSGR